MDSHKIEHIILSTGDEGVTLNNRIILTADPGCGDITSNIKKIADRLEKSLGYIYDEIKMETPHGMDWDWDDVLAVRAAMQSIEPSEALAAILARGIDICESDVDEYFFIFSTKETGLPHLETSDGNEDASVSRYYDSKDEAVMAAYQWVISVDNHRAAVAAYQSAQVEERAESPAP